MGEKTLSLEFRYEEVRRDFRAWVQTQWPVPAFGDLRMLQNMQRPAGVDSETDIIRRGRLYGIHREQLWNIVRTYLAVVELKVKYMSVLYMGRCVNMEEVI